MYREHAPCPELRPWVECLWTRTGGIAGTVHRVLPDGCLDLLFEGSRGRVVGAMSRALVVPSADARFVAVRFRPGRAWPFLGLPLHELADGQVPLGDLWAEVARLEDEVAGASSPAEVAGIVQRALLARRRAGREEAADRAAALLWRAGGRPAIGDLAERLGVSRQHLTRTFRARVGLGPKVFARVARFRRLLGRLESGAPDWADLAADLGYADQAHLAHEVRSLAGVRPGHLVPFLQDGGAPPGAP